VPKTVVVEMKESTASPTRSLNGTTIAGSTTIGETAPPDEAHNW